MQKNQQPIGIAKSKLVDGHEHAIVKRDDGTLTCTAARGIASAAHTHAVAVGDDGTVTLLASAGHTHEAPLAKTHDSAPHDAGAATLTLRDLMTPTQKLDTLTADYAKANNCDRPTARVAVMKTAEGRALYAESVGRSHVEAAARPVKAAADTTLAAEKQRELEAYAKSRGMRLADAVQTDEGKRLYAEQIRASRGGV